MVASLATSRSTVAHTTRSFRSARSEGQINGHRCSMVRSSAPRSAETGLRKLAGFGGAFIRSVAESIRCPRHIGGLSAARTLPWRSGRLLSDAQNQGARLNVSVEIERARTRTANEDR